MGLAGWQVDDEGKYEAQLGETIETVDYKECTSADYTCYPTMWMDRCITVKVSPPDIEFGCSPVLDSDDCYDDDYLPVRRLGCSLLIHSIASSL
jgi:hypothetical protein